MVIVASNTSPFRQMDQDKPIRRGRDEPGLLALRGHGVRSEHTHTQSTNTKETWNATGLVFKRRKIDPDNLGLVFDLVGGSIVWSFSGINQGCTYSAGPMTIDVKPDGSMGTMDISLWNPYLGGVFLRKHYAYGWNMPIVHGTITCPTTGTHPTDFSPHDFLQTGDPTAKPDLAGDGIVKEAGPPTSTRAAPVTPPTTGIWRHNHEKRSGHTPLGGAHQSRRASLTRRAAGQMIAMCDLLCLRPGERRRSTVLRGVRGGADHGVAVRRVR